MVLVMTEGGQTCSAVEDVETSRLFKGALRALKSHLPLFLIVHPMDCCKSEVCLRYECCESFPSAVYSLVKLHAVPQTDTPNWQKNQKQPVVSTEAVKPLLDVCLQSHKRERTILNTITGN